MDGYRGLRPRSRETARARLTDLRLVRDRRAQKALARHMAQAPPRANAASPLPASLPELTSPRVPDSDNSVATEAGSAQSRAPSPTTDEHAEASSLAVDMDGIRPRKHVRLSWLREKLRSGSGDRPTSSVILEIRSLLSRSSTYSSLRFSRSSSRRTSKQTTDSLLVFSDDEPARRNAATIQFCCQHRSECLHREALELCKNPWTSVSLSLKQRDSRDIWNETILHMVARWGDLSNQLITLLKRCDASIVNVRNIDGDTFLHILARRWVGLGEWPGWWSHHLGDIVKAADAKGFDFTACNTAGLSVLTALIPTAETLTDVTMAPPDPMRRVVRTLWGLLAVIRARKASTNLAHAVLGQPCFVHAIQAFFSALSGWRAELARTHGLDEMATLLEEEFTSLRQRAMVESLAAPSPAPSLHNYVENLSAMAVGPDLFLDVLRSGADANEYNAAGKTCLMALIEQVQSVERAALLPAVLLGEGADLRLLDREGNTALHYAVRHRLPDVVKQLIKAGVDVGARNARNETAPELAVQQLAGSKRPAGQEYASSQAMLVRFVDEKVLRRKQQDDRHADRVSKILLEVKEAQTAPNVNRALMESGFL